MKRTRAAGLVLLAMLSVLPLRGAPAGDVKPKPAPELPKKGWLNTPEGKPLRLEEQRGKVVLVEFWTFACFNCKNVLPYVKRWHEQYEKQGLVVIGVHTPELIFERPEENVRKAIQEQGITFPVVLDNDFAAWKRFDNHYWPAIYLVDAKGNIVYLAIGEGNYERTEARIQQLLQEANSGSR
ncbi:MAG: redoxin domain-containing protein [Candidatus Acidiferrales bacterium]